MIHLVLLSGGSGSRLWPLSNDARSKQFLKVLRDEQGGHVSMVQRVFSQIASVDAELDVTIATCANQQGGIEAQAAGLPCFLSNEIPREVGLSDQVQFLSIEDGPDLWAQAMSDIDRRHAASEKADFSSYNIESAAKKLEAMYL